MGFQIYWGHDLDLLGSRDVIDHVTIELGVGTFLLVVNDDHARKLGTCGPLELCVYLAPLRRYGAWMILGSRVWPFGVTWRHWSRGHSTRHMRFPIGGPFEQCVYLAQLRRYKASKLNLPMLKAKSSLRMLRVTWPVGGGFKITTYLEFPSPHSQLLWGYDDD